MERALYRAGNAGEIPHNELPGNGTHRPGKRGAGSRTRPDLRPAGSSRRQPLTPYRAKGAEAKRKDERDH